MSREQILIVEDELIVARDIYATLGRLGYRAYDMALSAEEALESIQRIKPDLILMDIKLKGHMDGIDLAKYIHQNYGDIPVIFISAYADENTIRRAKTANPYGFMLKPITGRELNAEINMAMMRYNTVKNLRTNDSKVINYLRNVDNGVIVTEKNSDICFINEIGSKLLGLEIDAILGKRLDEAYSVRIDHDNTYFGDENVRKYGELYSRTGEIIPICEEIMDITDQNGNNSGFLIIFKKLSERELQKAFSYDGVANASDNSNFSKSESSLGKSEKSNNSLKNFSSFQTKHKTKHDNNRSIFNAFDEDEYYRNIFRGQKKPLALIDQSLSIIMLNDSAVKLFGMEPQQFEQEGILANLREVGRKIFDQENFRQVEYYLNSNKAFNFNNFSNTHRISGTPVNDSMLLTIEPIEQNLENNGNLTTLQSVSGSFAHEFNNFLTIILGNITMARSEINPNSEIDEHLSTAIRATKKARNLIQQLLVFSKGNSSVLQKKSLSKLVKKFLCKRKKFSSVEYKLSISSGKLQALIDKSQILLLLENLLTFCEQRTKNNPKLSSTSSTTKQFSELDSKVYISLDEINGKTARRIFPKADIGRNYAHMEFSCNGLQNVGKIFEDNFLNNIGQLNSSELTLSAVRIIAENHGGYILHNHNLEFKDLGKFHLLLPILANTNKATETLENDTQLQNDTSKENPFAEIDRIKNLEKKKAKKESKNSENAPSLSSEIPTQSLTPKAFTSPSELKPTPQLKPRTSDFTAPGSAEHEQKRLNKFAIAEERKKITDNNQEDNPKKLGRILILEDEALIRKLMTLKLSKEGYEIIEAEEGKKAIDIFKREIADGNEIDLLITDLQIPGGMGGLEAFKNIRNLKPDIKAIVSSGYSDDPVMANYSEYGFLSALPKPYNLQELLRLVKNTIDNEST